MDIHHSWIDPINDNIISKIEQYQYKCIENNRYNKLFNNIEGITYYNKLNPYKILSAIIGQLNHRLI